LVAGVLRFAATIADRESAMICATAAITARPRNRYRQHNRQTLRKLPKTNVSSETPEKTPLGA